MKEVLGINDVFDNRREIPLIFELFNGSKIRIFTFTLLSLVLVMLWHRHWWSVGDIIETGVAHFYYIFLGIAGAIAANTTGAGGGIIFIPFFQFKQLDSQTMVATSTAVQCFGMTAGALFWGRALLAMPQESAFRPTSLSRGGSLSNPFFCERLWSILGVSIISALMGISSARHFLPHPGYLSINLFSTFSLIFGGIIVFHAIGFHPLKKNISSSVICQFVSGSVLMLIFVACFCFFGGMLTAWTSVGAGEMLAIVLLLAGYPVMMAVALAVILSAVCVLFSATHPLVYAHVDWLLLSFIAPGAMIGGACARAIAVRVGPYILKVFLGLWVFLSGAAHFLGVI